MSLLPRPIRARLDHLVQTRVDASLRPLHERQDDLDRRMDAVAARIDRLAAADDLKNVSERVDQLAAAVDLKNVSERVDRLDQLTGTAEQQLGRLEEQATWNAHQISRLAPQAAAFEQRLEREARPIVVRTDGEDLPEARLLVDVVREEHTRVRARLSTLSAYEERIRRLEEKAFRPPAG
jgi:tetrahydromethanopterin S-methyltransferase subunit G